MTDPLPDGFAPITPHLVVRGCAEAIAFYKRAFGAEELFSMPTPDGDRLMHAEIKVNGAPIMLADEFPGMGCESPQALGGTAVTLHLYTADIDADYARAVEAGCEAVMPPQDTITPSSSPVRSMLVSIVCERFFTGAEAFSAMRTAPGA